MKTTYWAAAIGIGFLLTGGTPPADAQPAKPAIRGLVSMGAFKFVGSGGDPVNTLEPLNAKPGIFGGIVIIASWAQLQPTSGSELESSVIDQALADEPQGLRRHDQIRRGAGCDLDRGVAGLRRIPDRPGRPAQALGGDGRGE